MNNLHIFYYNLIEFLSHENRCKLGILSKDIYQLTNRNGFYEYITYNPLVVANSNFKKKYEKHRNTINCININANNNLLYLLENKSYVSNIFNNKYMFNFKKIKHIFIHTYLQLHNHTTLLDLPNLETFIGNVKIDNCIFSSPNLKCVVGITHAKGVKVKSNKLQLYMDGKGCYMNNFKYNEYILDSLFKLAKLFKKDQAKSVYATVFDLYCAHNFDWPDKYKNLYQNWRLNNMHRWNNNKWNMYKYATNNKILFRKSARVKFILKHRKNYNLYDFTTDNKEWGIIMDNNGISSYDI